MDSQSLPVDISNAPNRGVVGSLISYGRSQGFLVGSHLFSPGIEQVSSEEDGEEDNLADDEDDDEHHLDNGSFSEQRDETIPHDDVDVLGWEEDSVSSPKTVSDRKTAAYRAPAWLRPGSSRPGGSNRRVDELHQAHTETSPLLRSSPSITFQERSQSLDGGLDVRRGTAENGLSSGTEGGRRPSYSSYEISKGKSIKALRPKIVGNSTYGQTLFNCIAILLGIGLLSEPLAFSCAGWVGGTILIIGYGFLSCYTAKILARIMISDPKLRTYADIGQKAFGPRSTVFTTFFFCLELFAVSVVLVVLASDSMREILPYFSSNTYKLIFLTILIPTTFLPLRLLSVASLLGVVSTLYMVFLVFWDGLSKLGGPGSLWDPEPTDLIVWDVKKVGLSFGLFMAGFAGHAVIPSIAIDMEDPIQFDGMINWAFVVATLTYGLIGASGYLMFGRTVTDEVSRDLLRTPGYNAILNNIGVWTLVISPLTKFALSSRPLSISIEILLRIDAPITKARPVLTPRPSTSALPRQIDSSSSAFSPQPPQKPSVPKRNNSSASNISVPLLTVQPYIHRQRNRVLRYTERTLVTLLIVATAILIPSFSTLMSFLGAFSSFVLCIIGPLAAKMCLDEGGAAVGDWILLIGACVMACWGTLAAFSEGA